ncbi:MAG: hypothetical protein VKK04_26530 [Synechococcales bacterium]|nr:hypothetical protein [Synechococcales bacterium]
MPDQTGISTWPTGDRPTSSLKFLQVSEGGMTGFSLIYLERLYPERLYPKRLRPEPVVFEVSPVPATPSLPSRDRHDSRPASRRISSYLAL